MKQDKKVMCYESLQDLSSYFRLTREKLTSAFIRGILNRAVEKFYSNNDDSSLVIREKLLDRIRDKHKGKFDNPDESDSSNLSSLWSSFVPGNMGSWKATDGGKWYLAGTEFQKLEGEREYHWKSGLTFVRFFTRTSEVPLGLRISTTTTEKIQILPFKVLWKANVKADGRFHDTSVVSISLENNTFKEPTEQEMVKYRAKKEES